MPSKSKNVRLDQKAFWEKQLQRRLEMLKEKGVEPGKSAKDMAVKKIRAKLRDTEARLSVIERRAEKVVEMAGTKAEKLATPKKMKAKKKGQEQTAAVSKRQQKKKKKKESKAQ